MVSLTQASITARKSVRYFIYFILLLIFGRMFLKTGIALYKKFFPSPPPPPTVSFSKLPKLPFADRIKPQVTFILETPEGTLPQFADQAYVFYMPKISPNLLSLDYAKTKFASLGFDPNPQQISETNYKFYHRGAPATIETNIVTGTFSLSYDLKADPAPLNTSPAPAEVATSTLQSYLSGANLLPEDLSGNVKSEYLKQEGDNFILAPSLSDSVLVKIHLFRKTYENLPVLTPDPNKANVWFIVSGARDKGKDIIAGEYHYFPVDETQKSTYPIKTSDIAWQEFIAGNYFLASQGGVTSGEEVKIRRIYLAYFDAGTYIEFMQPIFVFEGDKGFVGYIPAVTPDYYGE